MSKFFDIYFSDAQALEFLRIQKYFQSILHYLVTLEVPNKGYHNTRARFA